MLEFKILNNESLSYKRYSSKYALLIIIFVLSINLNQFITLHPFNGDEVTNDNFSLEINDNLVEKSTKTSFEEGVVGKWKFDETTGITAYDSSDNANDGTINGAQWTEGKYETALDFNGLGDYVQLQHINEYNFGTDTDFTISMWIKTSAESSKERLFSKGSYGFSITGYMMRMNYNKILLEVTNHTGDIKFMLESNSIVNDGLWHYIVGIVDRDQGAKIYIDGVLDAVQVIDTTADSFDSIINPTIGRYDASSIEAYEGAIDEVILYNKALNETEIATKYTGFIINLVTPENKIYSEPMTGYYPATYGFENEVIGTSHTDIDFIDWTDDPTTVVEIREELGDHKNYLYIKQNGWGAAANNFTNQLTGSVELYFRVNDATEKHIVTLREDNISVITIGLEFDNFFYINSSGLRVSIGTLCLNDIWYHMRIDFFSDNKFDWYLNNILVVDNQPTIINMEDGIDQLYFKEYDNLSELNIDAIGYSWDPNYNISDNLKEGLLISYTNNTELFWIGYSIDSLPYIYPGILGNFTISFPDDGNHNIVLFGNSTIGIIVSETKFFSIDTIAPIISDPEDFSFPFASTGYSIIWSVIDNYPANYIVYLNGTVYDEGTWTNNVKILLDSISEGLNIFVCSVSDVTGHISTDEVRVIVLPPLPDTTPPIISNPSDIAFEEGSIGFSIVWSASDDQTPWWASVWKNTTLIYNQTWTGNDIVISLDGLPVGYYVYNCTVYDKAWNYQFSIVTVDVTEEITSTTDSTTDSTTEKPSINITPGFTLSVLIAVIAVFGINILIRRRKI